MAFEASNELERSLIKAATDPAYRPQFYREFLSADLFAIQNGPALETAKSKTLRAGEVIEIMSVKREEQNIVPCFSSLHLLREFVKRDANYVMMKADRFLEMTKGEMVVLNPGADFGKEFTIQEIASMLDGSFEKPSEKYIVQKPTQILIGQPTNYPNELVAALCRYFRSTSYVKRAYLAHYFNPDRDAKPHTLIAIDVTAEWDCVVAGAGLVASSVSIPDPPIDFIQMTGKSGLEDHFRSGVKPFYQKKKRFGFF